VQFIIEGEEYPITVRHLFYRLVALGKIPKTERAYAGLIKFLTKWRRSGQIKWSAFADSTRWHIKSATWDSMADSLANTAATYRRNLWNNQKSYVEIWCEKGAMAAILSRAADPFGVPVFVARGFASLSSLYSAAETFQGYIDAGKSCVIYHFGDHDPSGVAACDSIQRAFRDDFKVDVKFVRAAVTREQIRRLKLLTRPTKKSPHANSWKGGDSVELDSMPPGEIAKLVEACIANHIDQRAWEMEKDIEDSERYLYAQFSRSFAASGKVDQ
jgi:hypothetical protein